MKDEESLLEIEHIDEGILLPVRAPAGGKKNRILVLSVGHYISCPGMMGRTNNKVVWATPYHRQSASSTICETHTLTYPDNKRSNCASLFPVAALRHKKQFLITDIIHAE